MKPFKYNKDIVIDLYGDNVTSGMDNSVEEILEWNLTYIGNKLMFYHLKSRHCVIKLL